MGSTEPENKPEGLSQDEMRSLIGEVFDERFKSYADQFASKDEVSALRSGIVEDVLGKVTDVLPAQTAALDEEGLLKKVSGLLDTKLAGISSGHSPRKPGPLGRFLLG